MRSFRKSPGPYQTRANLPREMTTDSFALLRSKLYPRNKQVVVESIDEGAQNYYAFFPDYYGYHSDPMGGARAMYTSEARLNKMRELYQITGAPNVSQFIPEPPKLPVPVSIRPNNTVHGYGIHNLPFDPEGELSPAGYRMRSALQQKPWMLTENPTTPFVTQSKAEKAVEDLQQVYFFDPIRRLP